MYTDIDILLESPDKEKLQQLIEQDVCLSGFEAIESIIVVEKGKESLDMYANERNGVSFFHEVGSKCWHVRVREKV